MKNSVLLRFTFRLLGIFLFGALNVTANAVTDEMPGGLLQSSEKTKVSSYELVLSPSIANGLHLGAELRSFLAEDISYGFSLLTGPKGFTVGPSLVWYISPDLPTQAAFAIQGSFQYYDSRDSNYVVTRLTPIFSKGVRSNSWHLVPYLGMPLFYYKGLGSASDDVSLKMSLGAEMFLKSFSGVKLFFEAGFYIINFHEFVFGLSYPLSTGS